MSKPMTLSTDLFTPQCGFVEGVVVEVSTKESNHIGYFQEVFLKNGWCSTGIRIKDSTNRFEAQHIDLDSIKSISILTGPMRFWSGAPADAVGLAYDPDDMVPLRFYDLAVEFKHDRLRFLMSEHKYVFTARPWWCDFGKGE
jgi:hypothetical protein